MEQTMNLKKQFEMIENGSERSNTNPLFIYQYNGLAVREDYKPMSIDEISFFCMDNLTNEMKLLAIKSDGLLIKYVINPTEEMKLEAVKNNGKAIEYISHPTYEMKLEAVKQDGMLIQFIENPSYEIQFIAVNQNKLAIQFIENPSDLIKSLCEK